MKTTQPNIRRAFHATLSAVLVVLASLHHALAGSASWLLVPANNDWNSAGNWTAGGPPNGFGQTATFNLTTNPALRFPSISADTEVDTISFLATANAFTITAAPTFTLTLSGAGITNSSGFTQNFVTAVNGAGDFGQIVFRNNATAGTDTAFTNNGATSGTDAGHIGFHDTSTAGRAIFTNNGGLSASAEGGLIEFFDDSTAGNATFTNHGGQVAGADGADVEFNDNSSAGSATFINNGGAAPGAEYGVTGFYDNSTAGNGTFINNGSAFDDPNAGGRTEFNNNSSAGAATLIANGGVGAGGGAIVFFGDSTGGTARVQVFGNGKLEISGHNAPGVTIGSLEGTGNVFLGANNLTVGSNNRSTIFSGVIQDGGLNGGVGGSLTKIGTGKLTLTGNNTYTGGTIIENGYLQVGSPWALGDGDVRVRVGVLGAYASQRDINVRGDYFQSGFSNPGSYSGGMLQLRLDGTGPGQFDRLVVTGAAHLGGELVIVSNNGFLPKLGDRFTIVTAGRGVSGRFAELEDPFKGNYAIKLGLLYASASVVLESQQDGFKQFARTANQTAVAGGLDSLDVGKAGKLLTFLDSIPGSQLPGLLDQIAPEELASIFNLSESLANIQTANLLRRMDDLRAGTSGFSSAGFAMSGSAGSYAAGFAGAAGPAGKGGKELIAPADNRWGYFVTGAGEFTKIGDTANARGYDLTTGGFTLGVDYRISEHIALGVNAGYARTGVDLNRGGRITVDGGKLGLYATYFTRGFYADTAVSGGLNGYSTRRAALQGTARGSENGGEFNALFATGYDWKAGALTLGPTANFQYTYTSLGSFTESGSLAPLHYGSQHGESLRTAVGAKASYDWKVRGVLIRPEVRAAWQHEYGDTAYTINSSIANGGGSLFSVQGPAIGRDSLLIGAGVAVLWNERTSTYVYYDGELGRSDYDSHNVSGGVRVSF